MRQVNCPDRFSSSFFARIAFTLILTGSVGFFAGCSSFEKLTSSNTTSAVQRDFVINSRWVRATTKKEFLGYRRMHRMSPLVLDNVIIQGNAIDGISAYDRASGSELWRLDLKNGVEGGAQVAEGNLFFGASDGNVYSVRVSDGHVNWTFPVHAETLAPLTVDNGVIFVENGADVVYALDAASGKQIWLYNRQTTSNFSIRATTRPTISGEHVFVGFTDGYVVALKKRDGAINWEKKIGKAARFRDVDATPVVDGANLYVSSFDGTLYSLVAETGNSNWQVDEGGYVPVTLGTGEFSDRLYYSTVNGKVLIIDNHSGKILETIKVKKGIATQPVFYKNLIVYGESEGALVVADAESGASLGRFSPGFGIMAKPTVIESTGDTYIMSSGANLFALKLGYERRADLLPWQKTVVAQ